MTEQNTTQSWNMDKALRYIYINEVIFVTLILLCFIGEILSEVTDRVAVLYWLCITPVFFYCSPFFSHFILAHIFYWGGFFSPEEKSI